MMMFRTIKTALTTLLGDQAAGRFRVIGYQRQSKASDEITGNSRLIQVYFSEGQFPKSGGMRGSKKHDLTIDIDISASAAAKGDLTVLENPQATEQQKAAAIAAIKLAGEVADTQLDELIDIVWNILMDARNERLGLDIGELSSRWIDRIQKDTLIERGDLIVKTANMKYTCRVDEEVQGDIGAEPAQVIIDSSLEVADTPGTGTQNTIVNI